MQRKLRSLLSLLFLPLITTCETSPPINQISTDKIKVYSCKDYIYLEFIGEKKYKAPLRLYNLYAENRHLIAPYYRQALENPKTLEDIIQIIDTNKDKTISWSEAISAYLSERTASELQNLLDQQIKISMSSQ